MRWLGYLLVLLPMAGWGQDRIPSNCLALADAETVVPAAFGGELPANTLRIRYLGHASFAIETAGGLLAVTDYTGLTGNPDVVPDVVTMNIAHDTHYTDAPDPRIPFVLRGWGPIGRPAAIELDLGEMLVRNVTTDLRGPFGEGGRKDGNSIFIFEVAGLCIGHLGHLHQVPNAAQYGAIGRLDAVMVPVDGGFTMDQAAVADVVRQLHPRIVLPMHWFTPENLASFLALMAPDFEIVSAIGPEVEISADTLPDHPTVLVLDAALIP